MMYAFGAADGLVRLAGCQSLSVNQEEGKLLVGKIGNDTVQSVQAAAHGINGAMTGKEENPSSNPRISFPSMR